MPKPFKGKKKRGFREREERDFEQRIIEISRVTRVMAGGKRMSFRACVALGDMKGRVAYGVAKGSDVQIAIEKAVRKGQKKFINVPLVNDTISHEVRAKFGAARIMLKPAPQGSGVKAGGVMRTVLELAGVQNVVGKMMGSKNKINNVHVTIGALESLKVHESTKKKQAAEVKKDVKKEDKKPEAKEVKKKKQLLRNSI